MFHQPPLRRMPLMQRIWTSRRLYLYILPTLLLLLTFSYWPAFSALFHSLYIWNPQGTSQFVGPANFADLYNDLFQPLPAMAPVAWKLLQAATWLGLAGMVAFFLLVERAAERGVRWPVIPAYVLLAAALGVVAVSLGVGVYHGSSLRAARAALAEAAGSGAGPNVLLRFIVLHMTFLLMGVLQLHGWQRYVDTRGAAGWRQLSAATVGAVLGGFMLLIDMSRGGDLRGSCWNLIRVMSFSLTVGLFMPLLIAEVLFNLKSERWKYAYRVMFVIPMVVPGIVGLLMWQFIYDTNWGILNRLIDEMGRPPLQTLVVAGIYLLALYLSVMAALLRKRRGESAGFAAMLAVALLTLPLLALVGFLIHRATGGDQTFTAFVASRSGFALLWAKLGIQRQAWLGDANIALYSLMLMGFPWVGTIAMLIFFAGLQSIPQSVLESAELDGATGLRRFFSIDFPLILGQFKLLLILGIIGGIQGFQNVLILTFGGPSKSTNMPGLIMFREAFDYSRLGYGTTIGVAMFFVILAITYVNMKYIRPSAEEESR